MASKYESWWVGEYPRYSIKDYEKMPVYLKFLECKAPFARGDAAKREAYWKDENCYIYEWFDQRSQTGEKFGLDYNSYTYFYEHWFMDALVHVVEKSWLRDPVEWGVVIEYHPDHEKHIIWNYSQDEQNIEFKEKSPEKLAWEKIGKKFTEDGIEDFTEKFWESPEQSGKELVWKKGNAEGEDKEYKKGEKIWGENKVVDQDYYKEVKWNLEGNKKWGTKAERQGTQQVEFNWEKDSENSFEETKNVNDEKVSGNIRSRSIGALYNVSWEGERPEVLKKTSKISKNARKNLIRSGKNENYSKIDPQLQEIYNQLKLDTKQRLEFLNSRQNSSEIDTKIARLYEQLNKSNLPRFFDSDSAIESISALISISKDLSAIEKSLMSSIPASNQFEKTFNEAIGTAQLLQTLLDPKNISDTKEELLNLSSLFEKKTIPEDKLLLIRNIMPLIRQMTVLKKQELDNLSEETVEITKKISNYLIQSIEVLKESQSTLEKIEKEFKIDDESTKPITDAYIQRSRNLIRSIENSLPYTETLPELFNLLIDIEKFKKEIISAEINKTLEDIVKYNLELSRELSEKLGVSADIVKIQSLQLIPFELSPLVKVLDSNEKVTRDLTRKLLRGYSSVKKINVAQQAEEALEKLFGNVSDVIFWIQGKKPWLASRLNELEADKNLAIAAIQKDGGSEEAIDSVLSVLKTLSDELHETMNSSISKNLLLILNKTKNIARTASNIFNVPIPQEIINLDAKPLTGDLDDIIKRSGFYLSFYFKATKETTGIDDDGENRGDIEESIKKFMEKKILSVLPFNLQDLLSLLKSKSKKEITKLKFLAGLVGNDDELEKCNSLEAKTIKFLESLEGKNNQEAIKNIDTYLKVYPETEREVTSETEKLLSILLQKLSSPEPLEGTVNELIETSEILDLTVKKIDPESVHELTKIKDRLPTIPSEIVPYLTSLVKDYAKLNFKLVSDLLDNPVTSEEQKEIKSATAKKIRAAPVLIIRDIQHLFQGLGPDDVIEIVRNLFELINSHADSITDWETYQKSKEKYSIIDQLTSSELRELSKDCIRMILSLFATEDLETFTKKIRTSTKKTKITSEITWEDIFKARGLNIDGAVLCENIIEEQQIAKNYIQQFFGMLGTPEQKVSAQDLIAKSEAIMKINDEASKIENYIQLRLEQTKLIKSLLQKTKNAYDRIIQLDIEKASSLKTGLSEVQILVGNNNPDLKQQLEVLIEKENNNVASLTENLFDVIIRLTTRIGLEKQLQRIKDDIKPSDDLEQKLIKNLSELEVSLYRSIKDLYNLLCLTSTELEPEDHSSIKFLTEPVISNTIPSLIASLNTGIESYNKIQQNIYKKISESSIKNILKSTLNFIKEQASLDDFQTEIVFSGIFRLCGSVEDKAAAKRIREGRVLYLGDSLEIIQLGILVESHVRTLLSARVSQSGLQAKLIKEAGSMRDGIDEADLLTEELISKASRDVSNTIPSDDNRSREVLGSIRKAIEEINEASPSNIPECIGRINKRLENWERLEKLRRELREKLSKEIIRLRNEVQEKLAELESARANYEGTKTQYEAQVALLQNLSDQNSSLVEKLTSEAALKEQEICVLKNKITEVTSKYETLEEDFNRIQDELDSNTKEIRTLRKGNKEKDSLVRDLDAKLENFQRNFEKNFSGDKEKMNLIENMKNEVNQYRAEVQNKNKVIDDLENKVAIYDKKNQRLENVINEKEKELESLKKEKSVLKAEVMRIGTEKNELEENYKIDQGGNPEEINQLIMILEEKQREIDEIESNLAIARRYQRLYLDLTSEKQETDEKLKESEILIDDYKRKIDELKQENDQLKYKTRGYDQLQKESSSFQKEIQKMQIRLNFLEQSEMNHDLVIQSKLLSEEVSNSRSAIEAITKELETQKLELAKQKKKHDVSLVRNFLVKFCHAFKEIERVHFKKWYKFDPNSFNKIVVIETVFPPAIKIDIQAEDQKHYEIGDAAILEETKSIIEKNLIMETYKSIDAKYDKPISHINIIKFLEELLDKKFEADKKAVLDSTQIQSINDFTLDYLKKSFGVESLAYKFLAQLITGLYRMYTDGQTYGMFFARFLQLFHPDPVPYSLSIYLLKIRSEFHRLSEKYERFLADQGKGKDPSKDTYGRSNYEAAVTGGSALLGDVIELIYNSFSTDKDAGLKALELLKPSSVSYEDFVAFKICHKMAKMGKTPEMIFSILDKDAGGTIDAKEFLTGTKEDLDLWISDENINKLMTHLDVEGTGEIRKEVFMGKISMKSLMQWNKNPMWTVSKASFLISVLEIYKYKQRKLAARLSSVISLQKGNISRETFKEILTGFTPAIETSELEYLYEETLKLDSAGISYNTLLSTMSKYGLGELKSFRLRELVPGEFEKKTPNKNSIPISY
jgi:hypothetical protein